MLRRNCHAIGLLAVAVAVLAVWTYLVPQVEAQGGRRILASAPATLQPGDTARLMVSNAGSSPVRVQLRLLDALDFSLLDSSETVELPARSSVFFEFKGSDEELQAIIAAVALQAGGRGARGVGVSLQVYDSLGRTQIFTDGFESGDVSA